MTTTEAVTDAERARRYRRKLTDLLDKVEAWDKSPTPARHADMMGEVRTVSLQLEVEERALKAQANGAGRELPYPQEGLE